MIPANRWLPPLGLLLLVATVPIALVAAASSSATADSSEHAQASDPETGVAVASTVTTETTADVLADNVLTTQSRRNRMVVKVLGFASLAGLLMFLAPVFWRRKFPGRASLLLRYGALSGVLLVLVVNLFSAAVLILQHTQVAVGDSTNPEAALHHASVDAVDAFNSSDAADAHRIVLGSLPTNRNVISAVFENAEHESGAEGFAALGATFEQLGSLLGLLPLAFVLLAIVFVIRASLPILTELIRLPSLAAGWPSSIARAATLSMVDNLWRELKATILLFGLVFSLAALGGMVVSLALTPAMELLLQQFAAAVAHGQSGLAPIGLLLVMLALALNLAVVVGSSALYLFRAQQILHGSFYERFTLRSHSAFWIGGTARLLLTWALVLGFWFAANAAIGPALKVLGSGVFATLTTSALLVLGGGVATFWLGRGFRALVFLAQYEIASDHDQTEPPMETNPGRRQRFLQLSAFPLAYTQNSMQHTQNVSPLPPPRRFPNATPSSPVPIPSEISEKRTQRNVVPPIQEVIPAEPAIEYGDVDDVEIEFDPKPPRRRRHMSGGISA